MVACLRYPPERLQFLLPSVNADPDAYARFRHEAEIASRLGHPNIVEVHDFDQLSNGVPYIVLELLRGETLADRLRHGPLLLESALEIARQVGSALSAAHNQGIVHRDLKTANIFLCSYGSTDPGHARVKVLDFGISKIKDSDTVHTQASVLMGTPRYMSPEQASAKSDLVDQRTDEFALAAIVYEMLSGQPAFPGREITEILMRVVYEAPKPLRDVMPELPPRVIAAVERGLQKNPDSRFPDVASFVALTEVTADFEAPGVTVSLAGSETESDESSQSEGTTLTIRQPHRRWAVGTAVIAALLTVVAFYFLVERNNRAAEPHVSSTRMLQSQSSNIIAVMEFENQRPDEPADNWFCRALQTAFNTELSKIPQLTVVAPEIIDRTAREGGLDGMTAARQLGVSRYITGSFAVLGNTLRIDARVVETANGFQEAAENVEGDRTEFFDLQKKLTVATLNYFRVRLTEAQQTALTEKTNAPLDRYRMLLGAEGITQQVPVPEPTPPGPQAERSAGDPVWPWNNPAFALVFTNASEAAVRQVLEEYRRAHEEGDIDRLASLYVSFPDTQRQSLTTYLKDITGLRVELLDVKIQPRENDVAVSYIRKDSFVDPNTGERVSLEVRITKFFIQDAGHWKFAN